MSEYEYEKVEGMTVGQVVDKILKGDDIFFRGRKIILANMSGAFMYKADFCEIDVFTLNSELKKGNLYTRKEKPWWDGCEGSVIMVRDSDSEEWVPCILDYYEGGDCFIASGDIPWSQARPLTAAERDAIKVRG